MRKYFSVRSRLNTGIAVLLFAILPGCEKDFDEIIDVSTANYQVTDITGIKDSIDLFKNPADSLLNLEIIFNSGSDVNKVFFNVYASDNSILNSSPVEMIPFGIDTFKNQFILNSNNPIGNYSIRFTVTAFNGVNKQVAITYFYFNNGQAYVAPVISNLVIPDTIARGVPFNFSVIVSDSNGLNDIDKEEGVFFILYRPDSTIVEQSPFYMHDDGDSGFGDDVAGDGIFSFRNSFLSTSQTGNWRFIFQAQDRIGLVSNIIEHLLYVQ